MTKDKLKDALKITGLWQSQYAPRIAMIKQAMKNKGMEEDIKKMDKLTTAQLIAKIDWMQSKGSFGRNWSDD